MPNWWQAVDLGSILSWRGFKSHRLHFFLSKPSCSTRSARRKNHACCLGFLEQLPYDVWFKKNFYILVLFFYHDCVFLFEMHPYTPIQLQLFGDFDVIAKCNQPTPVRFRQARLLLWRWNILGWRVPEVLKEIVKSRCICQCAMTLTRRNLFFYVIDQFLDAQSDDRLHLSMGESWYTKFWVVLKGSLHLVCQNISATYGNKTLSQDSDNNGCFNSCLHGAKSRTLSLHGTEEWEMMAWHNNTYIGASAPPHGKWSSPYPLHLLCSSKTKNKHRGITILPRNNNSHLASDNALCNHISVAHLILIHVGPPTPRWKWSLSAFPLF